MQMYAWGEALYIHLKILGNRRVMSSSIDWCVVPTDEVAQECFGYLAVSRLKHIFISKTMPDDASPEEIRVWVEWFPMSHCWETIFCHADYSGIYRLLFPMSILTGSLAERIILVGRPRQWVAINSIKNKVLILSSIHHSEMIIYDYQLDIGSHPFWPYIKRYQMSVSLRNSGFISCVLTSSQSA